jgi:hypothetical protein
MLVCLLAAVAAKASNCFQRRACLILEATVLDYGRISQRLFDLGINSCGISLTGLIAGENSSLCRQSLQVKG